MSDVTIHRGTPRENYTVFRNEIFECDQFSMDALGMLTYLLSRPRNWVVNQAQLRQRFKLGKDKFQRVMGELVEAGYVERRQQRRRNTNTFGPAQYHVFDRPISPKKPQPENPATDVNKGESNENMNGTEPQPGFPVTGSPGDRLTRLPENPPHNKEGIITKKDYYQSPLPPKGARVDAALAAFGDDWEQFKEAWQLTETDSFEAARRPWLGLSEEQRQLAARHAKGFQRDATGFLARMSAKKYLSEHRWEGQVANKKAELVFVIKDSQAWEAWRAYQGGKPLIESRHRNDKGQPGGWAKSLFPPRKGADTTKAG